MNTEGWAFFAWVRAHYPNFSLCIKTDVLLDTTNFWLWEQWRENR